MTAATFFGRFFDGCSSMPVPVALRFDDRCLVVVAPEFETRLQPGRYLMPERTERGQPIVRIRGGGQIEVDDVGALWAAAKSAGLRESWVTRVQQRWSLSIAALALTAMALLGAYEWGVPWAARQIAPWVPQSVELTLGREALSWLDDGVLKASKLPAARQQALSAKFRSMVAAAYPGSTSVPWRLEFRTGGEVGPNAFALPGGTIIVTDEIIALAGDEALLGVLAHEYGHVRQRHLMRRLLQVSALGAIAASLWGDFSGLAVAVPTLLGSLDYSRELEREADQEAAALLKAADMPVEPLIELFARIAALAGAGAGPDDSGESETRARRAHGAASLIERYLSSHPMTDERIAALREAAATR